MTEVRILRAGPGADDAERDRAVRAAATALSDGAVLAHPTQTVYGLGALRPDRDGAIARLKGRAEDRPLLRIGPGAATIRARHPDLRWREEAERLARAFWPGPLTLVLDDGSPDGLGVRAEGHPLTRRVLEMLEATMSSTSLNRTGEAPAAGPGEVRSALASMPGIGAPVAWLEAGELPGGPPSTVVSLRDGRPRILREGAVEAGRLEDALGREVARG